MKDQSTKGREWSWWYLLLVIDFVLVLWPSFYNRLEPAFFGIPFFYWYQLLCVIITSVITALVFLMTG